MNYSDMTKHELIKELTKLHKMSTVPETSGAGPGGEKDDMDVFELIVGNMPAEEKLRVKSHALGERVKELQCLYGISDLVEKPGITLEEIIQGTVELIPPGWHYPDITCVRIIMGSEEYTTHNFKVTPWKQSSVIKTPARRPGTLEVYYLDKRPELDEGPFLKEERKLIDAISERLGKIIERKQVEEALRESAERFRLFFENQPVYCYMVSTEGKIMNINKSMLTALGYDKEEIIGKPVITTIYAPSSRERAKSLFRKWKETGELRNEEMNIITKDGLERTVILSVEAMKDDKGNIFQSISTQRDITERKIAEEELSRERNLLRTLIDNLPAYIYVKDIESRFVIANRAVADVMGTTTDELIGKTDFDYYPGEIAEKFYADDQEFMRSGRAIVDREV